MTTDNCHRSEAISAATVSDAQDRLARAQEAIDCEAYERAVELAREAADELEALVTRETRERIERGLGNA